MRDVRQAVAEKNLDNAAAALKKAAPIIAKVASKGALHWRTAGSEDFPPDQTG